MKKKKKGPNAAQRKKKLEKELDKAWSLAVRERDKVCQKCAGHSSIAPHHAFGRRHMSTRWDLMNGVGLCFPCHIHWAHRDPGGFSVWFEEHVGRDQYLRLAEAHRIVTKFTEEDLNNILNFLTSGECHEIQSQFGG